MSKDDITKEIRRVFGGEPIESQWAFAQRLFAEHSPDDQRRLDQLRREILESARTQDHGGDLIPSSSRFAIIETVDRPLSRWEDVLFTPEVDRDDCLNGKAVSAKAVQELRLLLRKQHVAVRSVLRGSRYGGRQRR